jgi:hypothetical protein
MNSDSAFQSRCQRHCKPGSQDDESGVAHADEKLTAFLDLERVKRESSRFPKLGRLIRSAPAKSLIRQIDLLELVLRFLLKPDVIRESIGMPYFRLITVCLSYLFERRPRLNLKDPTIAVVRALEGAPKAGIRIAHRRKTKKGCNSVESFPLTGNRALHESRRITQFDCPNLSEKG